MESIYSAYLNDELWLINELGFARELQSIRESQFALGNGYLGSRGIYEEIPYDCSPGTYLAGVYDKMAAQVAELINLPNPVNFQFTVVGEKIGVVAMDIDSHKRVLNMKKALLLRHTVYKDSKKQRYDYQSLRFISGQNKNIGLMQIALTALDDDCVLDINTGIDTSVSNAGILSEGRKKHFRVKELGQYRKAGYLVADTFEKKHIIVYWSGFYYQLGKKKIVASDNIFRLKLKKNQTAIFTKVFCLKHFPNKKNYDLQKKSTFKIFNKAFQADFSSLLKAHTQAWERLWKRADVLIEGTANIQQNMRFNIYHMLICRHYDNGFSSIGARTLSGEGYRGHIFWDAEIFLFPFYLFAFPETAKNMLLYRYRRLGAARELAKSNGYKGAQFPWESGSSGQEETPDWARDIDRTIIEIHTHKMEHHITADIAYAFYKYYIATKDQEFMDKYGYEIFAETARFWASRVEHKPKSKVYEIKGVIGPDEFHINVNNNAFTNLMAKWNLLTASKLLNEVKKNKKVYKGLKNKLKLSENEVRRWRQISARMKVNNIKNKVIEQFDGYFKLKKIKLTATDENGILIMPKKMKTQDLGKTQIVKQADVLMLLSLLDDVFKPATKIANYDFYIPKTIHKSSLSAPTHAYIASKIGDLHRAYSLFNVSLRTDISNLYGNTAEGIHAASLGGTWQALVFGFAGVEIKKEELFINPRIPKSWRKVSCSVVWRGASVRMELTNGNVKIKIVSAQKKNVKMGVFDKQVTLKTNKVYQFKRRSESLETGGYY